jgi:hypothetical protein
MAGVPQIRWVLPQGDTLKMQSILAGTDNIHDFCSARVPPNCWPTVPDTLTRFLYQLYTNNRSTSPNYGTWLSQAYSGGVSPSEVEAQTIIWFEKKYPLELRTNKRETKTYRDLLTPGQYNPDTDILQLDIHANENLDIDYSPVDRKQVGLKILDFFFKPVRNPAVNSQLKTFMSFDAQSGIVSKMFGNMDQVINLVTPLNLADSAGTEKHLGGKNLYAYLPTRADGYIYTSNFHSSGIYQLNLKLNLGPNVPYERNTRYDFDIEVQYKLPNQPLRTPIKLVSNTSIHTGPSVAYLSQSIQSVSSRNGIPNSDGQMIDLSPLNPLLATSIDNVMKLLFDLKRGGDWEQANAAKNINNNTNGIYVACKSRTIFVTIDRLCALYSRLLGQNTIYHSGTEMILYRFDGNNLTQAQIEANKIAFIREKITALDGVVANTTTFIGSMNGTIERIRVNLMDTTGTTGTTFKYRSNPIVENILTTISRGLIIKSMSKFTEIFSLFDSEGLEVSVKGFRDAYGVLLSSPQHPQQVDELYTRILATKYSVFDDLSLLFGSSVTPENLLTYVPKNPIDSVKKIFLPGKFGYYSYDLLNNMKFGLAPFLSAVISYRPDSGRKSNSIQNNYELYQKTYFANIETLLLALGDSTVFDDGLLKEIKDIIKAGSDIDGVIRDIDGVISQVLTAIEVKVEIIDRLYREKGIISFQQQDIIRFRLCGILHIIIGIEYTPLPGVLPVGFNYTDNNALYDSQLKACVGAINTIINPSSTSTQRGGMAGRRSFFKGMTLRSKNILKPVINPDDQRKHRGKSTIVIRKEKTRGIIDKRRMRILNKTSVVLENFTVNLLNEFMKLSESISNIAERSISNIAERFIGTREQMSFDDFIQSIMTYPINANGINEILICAYEYINSVSSLILQIYDYSDDGKIELFFGADLYEIFRSYVALHIDICTLFGAVIYFNKFEDDSLIIHLLSHAAVSPGEKIEDQLKITDILSTLFELPGPGEDNIATHDDDHVDEEKFDDDDDGDDQENIQENIGIENSNGAIRHIFDTVLSSFKTTASVEYVNLSLLIFELSQCIITEMNSGIHHDNSVGYNVIVILFSFFYKIFTENIKLIFERGHTERSELELKLHGYHSGLFNFDHGIPTTQIQQLDKYNIHGLVSNIRTKTHHTHSKLHFVKPANISLIDRRGLIYGDDEKILLENLFIYDNLKPFMIELMEYIHNVRVSQIPAEIAAKEAENTGPMDASVGGKIKKRKYTKKTTHKYNNFTRKRNNKFNSKKNKRTCKRKNKKIRKSRKY